MSSTHHGNLLNSVTFEEHDGELNAKKVSLVSGATIYAVVNTSAAGDSVLNIGFATVSVSNPTLYAVVNTGAVGITNSIVTVANTVPVTFSGNVTLDDGSLTGIVGNVTLSDSKGFIGLTTTTLGASPAFIGIVTVANTIPTTFSGNITLDDGSLTGIIGNVTISDSKGFIGLTTTTLGASPAFIGHVTVANRLDLNSNVTLNASANYIGLASVNIGGGNVGLNAGVNNIGFASVTPVTAWPDPKVFIGLVTIGGISQVTLADPKKFIGLVTVGGIGTVTLSDPKGYIGLVTIGGIGTVTLSDPKGFIGLVTTQQGYNSQATIHTTIISAGSYATIYVPGAGQKFFIKSLHVSSLGRGEIEFRSGATTLIPMTALSTTSGFFEFYGENGLPARAADQAFVAHIPAAQTATIAIMVHSRFV